VARALSRLSVLGLLGLAACSSSEADWRPATITRAEAAIRTDIRDSAAQFWRVQVTGDDRTGQTCGFVTTRAGPYAEEKTGRFIVYIDQTADPYVEQGLGAHPMAQSDFDNAWRDDCVKEGYAS
jgi:hypothetical protein